MTAAVVDLKHARDITAEQFVAAIETAGRLCGRSTATRWDVAMVLGGLSDHVDSDPVLEVPGVPEKVVLAKARKLIRQGVISGCACGCRGDFEVVRSGA